MNIVQKNGQVDLSTHSSLHKRVMDEVDSPSSDQEGYLIEHFSKALKISSFNQELQPSWHQTKRRVNHLTQIDVEPLKEEDHACKRVKKAIERDETVIPWKKGNKRDSYDKDERARSGKYLKHADQSEINELSFQIEEGAPSWDEIEELKLVLPLLELLEQVENIAPEELIAKLSSLYAKGDPLIFHPRVFNRWIEMLCSFALLERELVLAVFEIKNRHGNSLLFDRGLSLAAYPYLERLIQTDPQLFYDLITLKDRDGGFIFSSFQGMRNLKEIFEFLTFRNPDLMLKLITLKDGTGSSILTTHFCFTELMDLVKRSVKDNEKFALDVAMLIGQAGDFILSKPEYVSSVVDCLKGMLNSKPALVEKILTLQLGEGKTFLSFPSFAAYAGSILKRLPGLSKQTSDVKSTLHTQSKTALKSLRESNYLNKYKN